MRRSFYCCRFYVTHNCSSFCSFCDTHSKDYPRASMTLSEAKKIIRNVWELGTRYIDFTGGEPTLNPHLPELIDYARSLGIKTEVTTNGALGMTDITSRAAMTADKFNVSLDTLSPELYASIRGTDSLSNTLEVIREASRLRRNAGLPSVKIMTTVTRRNVSSLDELLSFAATHHTEIYFNPVFEYFTGCDSPDYEQVIPMLESLTFRRNAVIMLHFLAFYQSKESVPCSADRHTLTIAADGSLMVPCYHSRNKLMVSSWSDRVHSPEFESLGKDSQCETCRVSPYFGISFSFRLDRFFLLASFSEKLVHLKRDYLNEFNLSFDEPALLTHLQELKAIIDSLNSSPVPEGDALYYAEPMPEGWYAPVYRRVVSREDYEEDIRASDCWELGRVPHREFDEISHSVFPKVVQGLRENPDDEELLMILSRAQEFMLRWWKHYVSVHFRTSEVCDIDSESRWLDEYFSRIRARFHEFRSAGGKN